MRELDYLTVANAIFHYPEEFRRQVLVMTVLCGLFYAPSRVITPSRRTLLMCIPEGVEGLEMTWLGDHSESDYIPITWRQRMEEEWQVTVFDDAPKVS